MVRVSLLSTPDQHTRFERQLNATAQAIKQQTGGEHMLHHNKPTTPQHYTHQRKRIHAVTIDNRHLYNELRCAAVTTLVGSEQPDALIQHQTQSRATHHDNKQPFPINAQHHRLSNVVRKDKCIISRLDLTTILGLGKSTQLELC